MICTFVPDSCGGVLQVAYTGNQAVRMQSAARQPYCTSGGGMWARAQAAACVRLVTPSLL
jgi:hypothetical protein